MTTSVLIGIILSALGVVGVPTIVAVWRLTRKWAQLEDKIDTVIEKEEDTKQELSGRFAAVDRELQWLREKMWSLYSRWGGKK